LFDQEELGNGAKEISRRFYSLLVGRERISGKLILPQKIAIFQFFDRLT
jgi:hypothetical protein